MDVELYDHEIAAMDRGPVRWMTENQGRMMDLESFRQASVEKFAEVGFKVNVKAYDTTERGTFAFDVEIIGRIEQNHKFDYDRQVHEVVNNLLDEPGVEKGFIKSDPGKLIIPDHKH